MCLIRVWKVDNIFSWTIYQSSQSREENVAKMFDVSYSEGFLVMQYICRYALNNNILPHLIKYIQYKLTCGSEIPALFACCFDNIYVFYTGVIWNYLLMPVLFSCWHIHTHAHTHTHTHSTILRPSWILSGTTQMSWHQRSKTRKVKPIWICWSKR